MAVVESIIQWVNSGMETPSEVMARRLYISMPGKLQFFFSAEK
jgi:hypothetical protein